MNLDVKNDNYKNFRYYLNYYRLTFKDNSENGGDKNIDIKKDTDIKNISVEFTDSNNKLFLANNIGISSFGRSDIKGAPISGYIESFINEELDAGNNKIKDVAEKLRSYFRIFEEIPKTYFHVAGYEIEDDKYVQYVWFVDVEKDSIKRLNKPDLSGANWGGETDILSRLIQKNGIIDNGEVKPYPYYRIPWTFFTIQDAIDFAIYAIRTTTESMRFQQRKRTVGGPIDILVIKPNGAYWIQKKELHGE